MRNTSTSSLGTLSDTGKLKISLAAEITKILQREQLTVRASAARTGIAAADFSRIRNAELDRFTIDRLMGILNRLGRRIDVRLRVEASSTGHGSRGQPTNRGLIKA